jgi:hypothetical protein
MWLAIANKQANSERKGLEFEQTTGEEAVRRMASQKTTIN